LRQGWKLPCLSKAQAKAAGADSSEPATPWATHAARKAVRQSCLGRAAETLPLPDRPSIAVLPVGRRTLRIAGR